MTVLIEHSLLRGYPASAYATHLNLTTAYTTEERSLYVLKTRVLELSCFRSLEFSIRQHSCKCLPCETPLYRAVTYNTSSTFIFML